MSAEVHVEAAILGGRTKRDVLATECLAEAPSFVLEVDEAVATDFAHVVVGYVFDRRQHLREGPWARLISFCRRRHAEGLVRPLMVIARPPFVEGALIVGEIPKAFIVDHFPLQGAVEALILALRLRMKRAAVQDLDAQPHQPDAEGGIGVVVAAIAPWWTIVHQHGERQPVAAEGRREVPTHSLALLIGAGGEHDVEAGVIVKHRERMAAAAAIHRDVALVVCLPKIIGVRPLEALPRPGMRCRRFRQPIISTQDLGDGARRRDARLAFPLERPLNRAPTPDIVAALAKHKHFGFHLKRCSPRAGLRPARVIAQALQTFSPIALQPLVGGRRTDPVTTAELPNVRAVLLRKRDELPPPAHCGYLAEWHPHTLPIRQSRKCQPCVRTGVNHVPRPYRGRESTAPFALQRALPRLHGLPLLNPPLPPPYGRDMIPFSILDLSPI